MLLLTTQTGFPSHFLLLLSIILPIVLAKVMHCNPEKNKPISIAGGNWECGEILATKLF